MSIKLFKIAQKFEYSTVHLSLNAAMTMMLVIAKQFNFKN